MTQAAILAASGSPGTTTGFKNKIINGQMWIDQRNAGASVTPATGAYTLDRWYIGASQASKFSVQQNAGSVTPPVGFSNYAGLTSLSAYTVGSSETFNFQQSIEGFNTADLQWGTADAKTVTLSFWVRSSLTGTFGGAFRNSAVNRSYPFSYTISAANTWEQKSITVAGDTSGTWIGATNGIGLNLIFSIGSGSTFQGTANTWQAGSYNSVAGQTSVVGTNGATWYITGVQLEVGTTATNFDFRSYGTELALCQRYYLKSYDQATVAGSAISGTYFGSIMSGFNGSATQVYLGGQSNFPVQMRTNPSINYYDMAGNGSKVSSLNGGSVALTNNVTAIYGIYQGSAGFSYSVLTQPNTWSLLAFTASAEL